MGGFKERLNLVIKNPKLMKIETLSFFIGFSRVFVAMLIPLLLFELNATFIQIGLIFGLSAVPHLSEPYFSFLADTKGKKKMILLGLLSGAIFFFAMFWFKDITILFVIALLLSVSFSAMIAGLNGRLTDLMPKKLVGEFTGFTSAFWDIGAVAGPITTGLIADAFGLQYAFLLGMVTFIFLFIYISTLRFK
jgi:MFS family permease